MSQYALPSYCLSLVEMDPHVVKNLLASTSTTRTTLDDRLFTFVHGREQEKQMATNRTITECSSNGIDFWGIKRTAIHVLNVISKVNTSTELTWNVTFSIESVSLFQLGIKSTNQVHESKWHRRESNGFVEDRWGDKLTTTRLGRRRFRPYHAKWKPQVM